MTLSALMLLAAAVIAIHMLGFWLASLPLRDVSIVDIGWGLGFVLVGWVVFFTAEATGPSTHLLLAMVTVWGVRLAAYLAWRNHEQPEDRRYARMRHKHGDRFWWISLLTVFALQGVVMWIVALPVIVGLWKSAELSPTSWLQWIGVFVWLVGLVFEAGGDWQLARFKSKAENEGEVCNTGLWRYTRHPNYFGDFCIWWGHWFVSLTSWATAWTIISPLVMSALLMKFSGVGLLEHDITDRRPDYAEYKRQTSTFFPWLPSQ